MTNFGQTYARYTGLNGATVWPISHHFRFALAPPFIKLINIMIVVGFLMASGIDESWSDRGNREKF